MVRPAIVAGLPILADIGPLVDIRSMFMEFDEDDDGT